jgi:uncharacterized protein YbjT (DUF2867 family)
MKILVTGATGYIGNRLTTTLIDQNHEVRCMVRNAKKLILPNGYKPEVAIADVSNRDQVAAALEGMDIAYYLIHSLGGPSKNLEETERINAQTFADVAKEKNIQRIIYLGGLGEDSDSLSPHLKSRHETGKILASGGIPVTEFRAGSVVGSGSMAFEILRYLTDRIPVMIAPNWLHTKTHPVGITDVLYYLSECLNMPETEGNIYEIGCPETMTYKEMMLRYAKIRGLKRFILTIPFLTPYISSLWVNLVTPLPRNVAMALFESIKNEIKADLTSVRSTFDHAPLEFEEAVQRALDKSKHWIFDSEKIPHLLERKIRNEGKREHLHSRGFIIEKRLRQTNISGKALFKIISNIGGKNGWPYGNWLWGIRIILDRIFGGKTRRQHSSPGKLEVGSRVDFWEVEKYEPEEKVLFRNVDMKIPGKAWLQFALTRNAEPVEGDRKLTMTAFYEPRGLLGVLYWYMLYPMHALIFKNTLERIIKSAAAEDHSSLKKM